MAREHAPSIIFMDEIDSLGRRVLKVHQEVIPKCKEQCWNC